MIRVLYQFPGDPTPKHKLFVVLCHRDGYAICLKATSKTTLYENNPGMMASVVYYAPGTCDCFGEPTAIQPDNQFPIPHSSILKAHRAGTLNAQVLPTSFEAAVKLAIQNSVTLNNRERTRILGII